MKSDLWSRATESCIYDQTVLAGAGFWEKLKEVRAKEIKTISSRFVYSIKKRPGDKYEAFARLTPRGFEEIQGEHYDGDHIFAGTLNSKLTVLFKLRVCSLAIILFIWTTVERSGIRRWSATCISLCLRDTITMMRTATNAA